eukprot:9250685-Alexandrium_andersonii.AAC.1
MGRRPAAVPWWRGAPRPTDPQAPCWAGASAAAGPAETGNSADPVAGLGPKVPTGGRSAGAAE